MVVARVPAKADQVARFGPSFNRLREVFERGGDASALRNDPSGLAPECLIVFEVTGSLGDFAGAARKVPGLEFIGDSEIEGDDEDSAPVLYLMVPDQQALREMLRLWVLWQKGGTFARGLTPWRDLFARLRDLRRWGPRDRVSPQARSVLAEAAAAEPDGLISIQFELIFIGDTQRADRNRETLRANIAQAGGTVVVARRHDALAHDALLARIPAGEVARIAALEEASLAGADPIAFIAPQSLASGTTSEEQVALGPVPDDGARGKPILAILDAVSLQQHPLLRDRLLLDDPDGLESLAVGRREHGTAMASIVIHGDRNAPEAPLPRPVLLLPVMFASGTPGERERFHQDRLIPDTFVRAIRHLKARPDATAPTVIIANVSLGDEHQSFHHRMSAWARALDILAVEHGVLFIVSAGNEASMIQLSAPATLDGFESLDDAGRARAIFAAADALKADRRLLAPAESVNALTIGGAHADQIVPRPGSKIGASNYDPYPDRAMPIVSSRLGPGFNMATKPEILLPGGRQRIAVRSGTPAPVVVPQKDGNRFAGIRVAAPPSLGQALDQESLQLGTSVAAALASRTAHRIHDGLEAAYPDFDDLPGIDRALILKALLVHAARWDEAGAAFIQQIAGPHDTRRHVIQKNNIRRHIGYGFVDPDTAIAAATDRATLFGTGALAPDQRVQFSVPLPACLGAKAIPHEVCATLAWFTWPAPGRQAYRTTRLKLIDPKEAVAELGLKAESRQPDANQANRGTVFTRRWSGNRAANVAPDGVLRIQVQREPDQGGGRRQPVPFALAVTIAMPGEVRLYDEVRARLAVQPRQPVQVPA
jgi:hypothetical protein